VIDRINVTDIANRTSIAKLNTDTVFYSVDGVPNQYITMGADGNNILSAKEARSLIIE
jgi:PhoPQ-activated pathogenicity-related protein